MFRFKQRVMKVVLICTCITALTVGCVSLAMLAHSSREAANAQLTLRCDRAAMEVDNALEKIKIGTELGYNQLMHGVYDHPAMLDDGDALRQFSAKLEDNIVSNARYVNSCVAVYVRFDPALPHDGFFYTRDGNGHLTKHELTDMSLYSPDDVEHVGWYYIPVRAGEATWTEPYLNKNLNIPMISYVIPLFYEGRTVGVVGMDINFDYISNVVKSLGVYEHGFAFATQGDHVVAHPELSFYTPTSLLPGVQDLNLSTRLQPGELVLGQYKTSNETMYFAKRMLSSGLQLVLCAPFDDVYADVISLLKQLFAVTVGAALIVLLVMNRVLSYVNRVATRDNITDLLNRESLRREYAKLCNDDVDYVLFMVNIVRFKQLNNDFGHEQGDRALYQVAEAMRDVMGTDTIARWSGDEFVGIVKADGVDKKIAALCQRVAEDNDQVYGAISVNVGACKVDKTAYLNDLVKLASQAVDEARTNIGCNVVWVK